WRCNGDTTAATRRCHHDACAARRHQERRHHRNVCLKRRGAGPCRNSRRNLLLPITAISAASTLKRDVFGFFLPHRRSGVGPTFVAQPEMEKFYENACVSRWAGVVLSKRNQSKGERCQRHLAMPAFDQASCHIECRWQFNLCLGGLLEA
ncbi:hypothetical protein JG688_00005445, partial [Phytophthora aleatoria]